MFIASSHARLRRGARCRHRGWRGVRSHRSDKPGGIRRHRLWESDWSCIRGSEHSGDRRGAQRARVKTQDENREGDEGCRFRAVVAG